MEQRRKIIIPTGTEGEETLSTPHFDAEATLTARPVVPLAEAAAPPPEDAYAASRGPRAAQPAGASPWKRSTLIFIILAAVGVGIASGLVIGLYQSRQKPPAASVAAQPAVNETQQAATQPEPPPRVGQQAEAEQETEAPAPVVPADDEAKNNQRDEPERDERPAPRAEQKRTDEQRRNDERASPPVVRDRRTNDDDDAAADERAEREARREARREERRERRREERRRQREETADAPLDIPRNVERARQEINRIRDIFEGRQP